MNYVMYLKCCRIWPIVPTAAWGRCKLCGRKPLETPTPEEVAEYLKDLAKRKEALCS